MSRSSCVRPNHYDIVLLKLDLSPNHHDMEGNVMKPLENPIARGVSMAAALSAHCVTQQQPQRYRLGRSLGGSGGPSLWRYPGSVCVFPARGRRTFCRVTCSAADVPAGYTAGGDDNPYEVLGVNPLESFEKIKAAYTKKHRDAERSGDDVATARFEKAYDKIMMSQLSKRKQGLTFGAVEVSKNIKYADKVPLIPWGPKKAQSSKRDIWINVGVSVAMSLWVIVSGGAADWKPLQFLIFGYVFQLFFKLKGYEPPEAPVSFDEEDQSRRVSRSGKRLLRTFALVFGSVTIASLAFTGILNAIELMGSSIPLAFYNSQETFVTLVSAVLLFFIGSFYR